MVGIFIPTSIDGEISAPLSLAAFLLPALILVTIKWNGWQQNRIGYLALLFGLMLFFTMISPFPYVAWGGAAPYILMAVVLLFDFRISRKMLNFRADRLLMLSVFIIDALILIAGFGILMDQTLWTEIIQRSYQFFSEELYEQMIVWHSKPVTVFGSHSTAAFAYFALFVLNFKIFKSACVGLPWRVVYLLFAVGFVVLNWFLNSNTSVAMTILMVLFLAAKPIKMLPRRFIAIALPWALIFIAVIIFDAGLFQSMFDGSEGNGFLARYTSGGRLQSTYDYLIDNYFIPIGISYSPELGLGDNFIAEYVVKISIFGYLIVLYLLWGWLVRHLRRHQAMAFFVFFVLADLAYPLLVYSRVAAALPFFVLIWQRLDAGVFLKKSDENQSSFWVS